MENFSSSVSDQQIRDLFTSQIKNHPEVAAAIEGYNLNGYPVGLINIMEHDQLNRLAARNGMKNPDYKNNPIEVYKRVYREVGVSFCDQWIPENPLSMGNHGYVNTEATATTGLKNIVLDGITIKEPEDVVEHMERFVFPALENQIENFDREECIRRTGLSEYNIQNEIGLDILKTGYGTILMPEFAYGAYGYENYFCAYLLYEDVIAKHFKLQAELYRKNNEAVAEAYKRYNLPKIHRCDHDVTDSSGTLVDIKSMDRIWFPQLAYCLEPVLKNSDIRIIWHCDGNIMPMIPRLLDIGIRGFQGFQYEDGVDFASLCKMRSNDGLPLFMEAGVSVTRTLPFGTPEDVRKQMDYFVEVHGDTALTLACSSSMAPGVSSENIDALIEGFHYYKNNRK